VKAFTRSSSARRAIAAALSVALLPVLSAGAERPPLTSREKALHALNRLAFGPRPGDVDRVLDMGVSAWIEGQLSPERIEDDEVEAELRGLPTLSMTSADLFDRYERPIREARRAGKDAGESPQAQAAKMREAIPPENRPRRIVEELSAARVVRAADSRRQLNEVLVDFWMNHFNVYAAKGLDRIFLTSFERDTVRPLLWGKFEDLLAATAKSPAMLFYLDNARSVAEEANRPERRPLRAAFAMERPVNTNAPRGLNENYARELMELHTLGVDGGYTQKDVTELARILTGWSIEPQRGAFVFRAAMHDVRPKTFLGRSFPAGGGMEEGEAAIRMLARDPRTARRIALLLCQRLVADDPPARLVDRVAARFLATGGELRETVRAIVTSPEFFDPAYYRAKIKSPFEYVVSAVRASGARTDGRLPVLRAIGQMGEPLYLCQPPTGYSDASSAWISTGGFVYRLNFALALASNRVPGVDVDVAGLLPPWQACDEKGSVEPLARTLTGDDLSPETRRTIEKRLVERAPSGAASTGSDLPLVAGLILGSPEFQRQ
jgi:uncharacterized protein (DUF1800 family)